MRAKSQAQSGHCGVRDPAHAWKLTHENGETRAILRFSARESNSEVVCAEQGIVQEG